MSQGGAQQQLAGHSFLATQAVAVTPPHWRSTNCGTARMQHRARMIRLRGRTYEPTSAGTFTRRVHARTGAGRSASRLGVVSGEFTRAVADAAAADASDEQQMEEAFSDEPRVEHYGGLVMTTDASLATHRPLLCGGPTYYESSSVFEGGTS